MLNYFLLLKHYVYAVSRIYYFRCGIQLALEYSSVQPYRNRMAEELVCWSLWIRKFHYKLASNFVKCWSIFIFCFAIGHDNMFAIKLSLELQSLVKCISTIAYNGWRPGTLWFACSILCLLFTASHSLVAQNHIKYHSKCTNTRQILGGGIAASQNFPSNDGDTLSPQLTPYSASPLGLLERFFLGSLCTLIGALFCEIFSTILERNFCATLQNRNIQWQFERDVAWEWLPC